ncbi:TetR/AcrR family transcriptional regulator [Microbacterium sp.]|uniref:TetR/AcrR family transcriptional regulator n=1 Tax=Microbacterium sp. TaxID=51671 RepID=UPI003A8DB891
MGQREDLLAGAKRCISERGYAHTTARDIVAVSGANLAAIGYHFGSKDALLSTAIIETFNEWGDSLGDAITEQIGDTPQARLEGFVAGLLDGAAAERAILVASVQAYAQAEFTPEVREQIARTYVESRRDLAALVIGRQPEDVSPEEAASVGSLALALINGAVLQWLIDPERAPSAKDLSTGIHRIVTG